MGKGKGSAEVEVNEYLMSMHVGIASSLDALTGIYVGEKLAWSGEQSTMADISIAKPSLFGGPKKEGGVQGIATYLPGTPDQIMPDGLAQKMGRASGADCPGFRGISSLFFSSYTPSGSTGGLFGDLSSAFNTRQGFHWVTNNPYLKDLWVKGRRLAKGLNPGTAAIPRLGGSGLVQFSSGAPVVLQWWQRSYPQAGGINDKARMGIRYYDADGEPLGDTTWASMIATATDVWTQRTLNSTVPSNCYSIRIYMEMERVSGSYNDGYIDDITMTIDGASVAVTNAGGEISGNYGWVNEVGDIGWRFTNPAPHGGTAYFTGGSYALSRAYQSFSEAATGDDANPAHIIYECLTDRDFGMGASPSIIDIASFEAAATTLLFERLGLSLLWTRQTTIEAFISEILDHIQAVLYVNPRNGLMTLKLIRGDYDVADLRVINVDNAKLKNYQRRGWGEITNEVVVTWTNPENEQEETVTLQDNAAIASQGGIVSDSRNYYGVRTAELAMRLAARDLRTASTPLATCEAELNRSAWDLLPGEVVLLNWPERGLYDVPMRVGPVDYGKPGDPSITASLLEDIFSYATTDYSVPPSSEWQEDDATPVAMAHSKIVTVPSFFAANYLPVTTAGIADIEYPEVIAGVLASSQNAVSYDIYGDVVAVDGTVSQTALTTNDVAGYGTTSGALAREAESVFVGFTGLMGKVIPAQNVFVVFGDDATPDETSEIALISEVTGNTFTLKRGVLDTVPRTWPSGTPVYFVTINTRISDLNIRSDAESVTFKLLSRTIGGILDSDVAPDLTGTLNGRPHYPLRPANVKVNDVAFASVNIAGLDPVPVTWANRNRTMENSQVVYWDDANVTPEVGQTTKITLLTSGGTVITSYAGLTGSSYNVPASGFAGNTNAFIRVSSERDGLESLQSYDVNVFSDGSGGTGEGSGGGTDPTYGDSADWDTFNDISTTSYAPLVTVQSISANSGGTISATADLTYYNNINGYRFMRAKWQYAVSGTTDWVDFGAPVDGTNANGVLDIEGEITVTQEVANVPGGDYDVRLVAIVSSGGAVLYSSGTASVVASGGIAPSKPASFTATDAAEYTTTSTTLTDLFTTTIGTGNQAANAVYLGFWGAEFQNTTNNVMTKVTLTKNGTPVYPSDTTVRTNFNTEYPAHAGMFVHSAGSAPAAVTYAIQYANASASTLKGRNARISWLKLGTNDAYVTAYPQQTTVSTTQIDAATLNFTPPSSGDYLILCSFVVSNSAATASAYVQVSDGTTSSTEYNVYGANDAQHSGMIPLVLTGASGAKTVNLKVRTSTGSNTVTIQNVVLVALRLDRFANNYRSLLTSANTGADTTYTATATQTFTPAAGKHLSLASWAVYGGGGTSSSSRTQIKYSDGATDVSASDRAILSTTASRAIVGWSHTIADYTATSRTQTLYRAANGGASISVAAGSGVITLSLVGLT